MVTLHTLCIYKHTHIHVYIKEKYIRFIYKMSIFIYNINDIQIYILTNIFYIYTYIHTCEYLYINNKYTVTHTYSM